MSILDALLLDSKPLADICRLRRDDPRSELRQGTCDLFLKPSRHQDSFLGSFAVSAYFSGFRTSSDADKATIGLNPKPHKCIKHHKEASPTQPTCPETSKGLIACRSGAANAIGPIFQRMELFCMPSYAGLKVPKAKATAQGLPV